ncbi:hypothetical protein HPP92_002887 [Vanilla planifolia]|uniref:Methyltransferase-like protein 17, mitochondrial n=1 Tax=Vanilla planifolia TaxID=51239 RepID=A0A835S9B4_VANPL|nr:hypothetical protein HPP92_002887 [Vanilla planifolia]
MNRKVLYLSQCFNRIKQANLLMIASASRELVEDPFRPVEHGGARWKMRSAYGDIGLKYKEDETVAYVASRMPAVYSACHRVLKEVRRRLPEFSPTSMLDFGSGPGSALWAMREVWPQPLERVNLVEPSKDMQRAAQSLLRDLKGVPIIHSYDSIQELNQNLEKRERKHDIVISSYALGEISSLRDRITLVRQLWDLTRDVLVLLEPGTPHGSKIIWQLRRYVLWMAKRKHRKSEKSDEVCCHEKSIVDRGAVREGAFVIAPCSHDGRCPLENSGKYCHFVQRLERTSSQRAYKRSKGEPLRGFEDEKFCFVALRRGKRPEEAWPLDGVKFETLKEKLAKRKPEDLIIDYEDQLGPEVEEAFSYDEEEDNSYASDVSEIALFNKNDDEHGDDVVDSVESANLGGGWGRILYTPLRRGKRITMDVCRSTKRDASEGAFERITVTHRHSPELHLQARRSLWGDLWPF